MTLHYIILQLYNIKLKKSSYTISTKNYSLYFIQTKQKTICSNNYNLLSFCRDTAFYSTNQNISTELTYDLSIISINVSHIFTTVSFWKIVYFEYINESEIKNVCGF